MEAPVRQRSALTYQLTSQTQNPHGEHAALVDGGLTEFVHYIMSRTIPTPINMVRPIHNALAAASAWRNEQRGEAEKEDFIWFRNLHPTPKLEELPPTNAAANALDVKDP